MAQAVLQVSGLPDAALDAAAAFHAEWLAPARALLTEEAEALALVFAPAPFAHTAWRRVAVAELAREATPKRVNGVAGEEGAALTATLAWLAQAPGITGQLLPVAGTPVQMPSE